MYFRQALISMMQLFSVFFFFSIGFMCVCLPFSAPLRFHLAKVLTEEPEVLVWIGIGFFILTLLLTLGFYAIGKGRFLLLRMGNNLAEVDVSIIKKTISPLLEKFDSKIELLDVEIFKNEHLRIGLSIPPMDEKEKKKKLLKVERHLQTILKMRFGYRRSFTIQLKS